MAFLPKVNIEQGQLVGKECRTKKGTRYYSFQGIPYAKPPLGKFRFRAPQPPEPWDDVNIWDARSERPHCYQRNILNFDIDGKEDCLYLNVYTPELNYDSFPVMVWIHGGAFVAGSGNQELYGPEFLMTRNVILVTFNYRVGMLGFMSFEDEKIRVPGNAGLKDQVMVLKWIKKNISKFRGNKNNVTLFGHDAGAACVHLHMLSPMSKGLFHKAILQSGCALNPWVNGIFGTGRILAKFLEIEGCDEKMLEKLKKLPVETIFEAQEKLTNSNSVDIKWFCSPVIEKQKNTPAFLPDYPLNIIRSGDYNKVPMIIGYTDREGIYWDIYNRCTRNFPGLPDIITNFSTVIPNNVNAKKESLIRQTIAKKIKAFYYGSRVQETRMGRHPRFKMMDPTYQLLTDVFFLRGINSTVKNHNEVAPEVNIYYYKFTFESRLNIFKNMLPFHHRRKYPGAVHGDELGYLFSTSLTPVILFGDIEDVAINKLVRLWTTFAAHGYPMYSMCEEGYNWNPVFKKAMQYMEIGEEMKMDYYPDNERMRFWDIIYKNDKRTENL